MKEKLPLEILILAGRLSLDGVVTVCVKSARMLRVDDKNFARLSRLSARATTLKVVATAVKQTIRIQALIAENGFMSTFNNKYAEMIELVKPGRVFSTRGGTATRVTIIDAEIIELKLEENEPVTTTRSHIPHLFFYKIS
jgi:hypothetical protein